MRITRSWTEILLNFIMAFSSNISENYTNFSNSIKPHNISATESIYGTYAERQILSGVGFVATFVGLLGNLAVIFAILTVKKLQTKTNVFVLNLAVADVLTCTVAPLQAVTILSDELVIPSWLCKLVAFCIITCIGCSINTLALIAVNRLVGITTTAMYHKVYTPIRLFLMIVMSWAVPIAVATIPLFSNYAKYGFNPIYKSCTWSSNMSYIITYAKLISVMYFPLQFTILFVSYLKIYLYVTRTTQSMLRLDKYGGTTGLGSQTLQIQLWKRQVTVTKNLFTVVCVFFLCMCPYFATLGLPSNVGKSLLSYASLVLMSNSAVNPIIYGTKHPDFRTAFAHILRCKRKKYKPQTPRTKSGQNSTTIATISANLQLQLV
ncbi:beta-4C adrenergic receptor-like [Patiria miniata]|uniref:G-protein coupled receptors family 1 profile domain-containing protein n=1 Tax=Patiria miniata TaxID=46514 RepID=A0A913YXU3_PATMI|nr:beta-4C adrenergic receptor-like [Patiria miniata]